MTNHALDTLLRESGYDHAHAAFARQINHAARDQGILRYDASTVYWWLRGRRPSGDIQKTITTLLGRRLNRVVTTDELGFDQAASVDLAYSASHADTVSAVTRLWSRIAASGMHQPTARFDPDDAVQTAMAWRFDPDDPDVAHHGRRQITTADVVALHVMAEHFTDLDRRHGGAGVHTRSILADFLHTQVAPMLTSAYTDDTGRALMGATATLVGQLAFMDYDAGDHGWGQRHFTVGLRLAKAAGDQWYGAHLLANLATQALYLGHGRQAVRLSRAAIDGATRAPASVRARLATAEACAHAVVGDRLACAAALGQAAAAMDHIGSNDPPWVAYFTPAHYAGTAMRCHRDLGLYRQALRHSTAALDLAGSNIRTRALHTALLATVHVAAGNLDEACHIGHIAMQQSAGIQSGRVQGRIVELVTAFEPHARVSCVRAFLDEHRASRQAST